MKTLIITMMMVLVAMPALAKSKGMKGHDKWDNKEKIVEKKVEKMTKNLGLSAEQAGQLKALMQEKMAKRNAIHEEMKAKMDAIRDEFEIKLKTILTPEQLKKHEAKRKKMGGRHGRKHHGEHGEKGSDQ